MYITMSKQVKIAHITFVVLRPRPKRPLKWYYDQNISSFFFQFLKTRSLNT